MSVETQDFVTRNELDIRLNGVDEQAKVDSLQMKFGWYLTLFGVGVSALIFLAQKFFG